MRYLVLLILTASFVLTACSGVYYPEQGIDGMQIVEIVHTDPDTLFDACASDSYGRQAEACALLVGNTCTLHLPERYSPFLYEHELSHCYGREDAPPVAMWKG